MERPTLEQLRATQLHLQDDRTMLSKQNANTRETCGVHLDVLDHLVDEAITFETTATTIGTIFEPKPSISWIVNVNIKADTDAGEIMEAVALGLARAQERYAATPGVHH
jgi:hypothetical protein